MYLRPLVIVTLELGKVLQLMLRLDKGVQNVALHESLAGGRLRLVPCACRLAVIGAHGKSSVHDIHHDIQMSAMPHCKGDHVSTDSM